MTEVVPAKRGEAQHHRHLHHQNGQGHAAAAPAPAPRNSGVGLSGARSCCQRGAQAGLHSSGEQALCGSAWSVAVLTLTIIALVLVLARAHALVPAPSPSTALVPTVAAEVTHHCGPAHGTDGH
jgi:hypothetical protein